MGAGADVAFALTVVEEPESRTIENLVEIADDGANGPDQNPDDNLFVLITPFPPLVIPVFDQRALALLAMMMVLLAGWNLPRSRRQRG